MEVYIRREIFLSPFLSISMATRRIFWGVLSLVVGLVSFLLDGNIGLGAGIVAIVCGAITFGARSGAGKVMGTFGFLLGLAKVILVIIYLSSGIAFFHVNWLYPHV